MKNIIILIIAALLVSCSEQEQPQKKESAHGEGLTKDDYNKKGQVISGEVMGTLAMEVKQAIETKGIAEAVRYCNAKAYPITSKLSDDFGVEIRRVSGKNRNPLNAPDKNEEKMLSRFENELAEGQELKPVLEELPDGSKVYYAPIKIIMPLCLNCHGNPETDINTETYNVIKQLYPDDKAVGYKMGDLRGMWAIKFKK